VTSTTEQLVFELNGLLVAASVFFFLYEDPQELERAKRAVRLRLEASA
jgi:hypothetical protein